MTLDCIEGYIMGVAVIDMSLNMLPHIRMKFIDDSMSSYCSMINSAKRIEQIRQTNKLAYILCDLESGQMR